jgi:hypothetical protein
MYVCLQNEYTSVTRTTTNGLPWVDRQPLPTAAMTSLLGMLWSAEDSNMAPAAKHRLRCFALDQVGSSSP